MGYFPTTNDISEKGQCLNLRGSTGDPPVPLGDSPSGTEAVVKIPAVAGLFQAFRHSVRRVAGRDGPVAHATLRLRHYPDTVAGGRFTRSFTVLPFPGAL